MTAPARERVLTAPRTGQPAALVAEGVSVSLGGRAVLSAAGLSVHRGEVVALVGPNGAGKSTLLAALAGDLPCDSGRVLVGGTELATFPVTDLARRRAVQVQEQRLSFAFTVEDVVRMGRAPWHRTPHEDRDDHVVATALDTTETTTFTARRFPTLSGGEKARVSFSRAIAQETAVLLLDEPTAALDIRHQEAVLLEVRRRAAAGVAVVVVLHDLSLAAAYADRVVLLQDGRVRAEGTPHQVFTPELLEQVYRHPVAVYEHEESGGLVVLPIRAHRRAAPTQESP